MPTIDPQDNSNQLPDSFSFDKPGLSAEESFQLSIFSRGINRCNDVKKLQEVCTQLTQYYVHSQNLLKTLALDNLEGRPTKDKEEKIVKASEIFKKAKDSL